VHGLALVRAPAGTLISLANAPGRISRRSLYSDQLLQAMEEPDIPVGQALQRLGEKVAKASKGRQSPWLAGHIEGISASPAGGLPVPA